MQRRWLVMLIALVLAGLMGIAPVAARPEGTLTVAVATFGSERWLPHLYVGAEDLVFKPMYENLLSRDPPHTGALTPLLAERWEMLVRSGLVVSPAERSVMFQIATAR